MNPSLEERIATNEAGIHELRADVKEIKQDVHSMRTELAGRPTWAVVTILAGLGSLCTALGTTLLMLLVNQ